MTVQRIIAALFFFWIKVIIASDIDSLSLDTSIRYGKLSNGLTYYIKVLPKTRSGLTMHFYIKAGSYQQDEDQLDIAHAVEHMAFKGSKHFPIPILNDMELLAKLGMKQQDIFAQTGQTTTQYYFRFPAKNIKALNSGLLFFHDIATGLKMDKKDIDNERGALRQEAIYRVGSKWEDFYLKKKMESKIFPCSSDFTDFFKHNRTFKPESVIEFYKDWYRPDLMALVVVGDIDDVSILEERIKKEFSDIPPHKNPRKRNDCGLQYLNQTPQYVVLKEKANQAKEYRNGTIELNLYFKDSGFENELNTWGGLKRKVMWPLITGMLNDRLREAGKVYNSYYKSYSIPPVHHFPALRVKITAENQMEQKALWETLQKIEEVRRLGFSAEEWEDTKLEHMKMMEVQDTDKTEYWIEQIQNHYVYGESLPDQKHSVIKNWFSKLSVEDFNLLVRDFISNMPDDISIIAPDGAGALLYSEKEIREWISKSQKGPVFTYSVSQAPKELIKSDELLKLKITTFTDNGIGETGAKEILLKNGVKVMLQSYNPTSGRKKERIMLHGFSTKGASCFAKEDYFNAINSPGIVKNAGVGSLNKFELDGYMANTSLRQGLYPYIDYYETGIRGDALPKDVEKMLQLVYLYFSNPRKDSIAFHDWKKSELNSYLHPRYGVIQEDFNVKVREILGDSTITPRGTIRLEGISKTDMQRAYGIYKMLFGNAKNFTFIISGNFSIEKLMPLVQKYLGNLPNINSPDFCETSKITAKSIPKLPAFQTILSPDNYDMKSVKYLTTFVNQKPIASTDWKEDIKISILGSLMNSKIKELRFKKGASLYYLVAGIDINKYTSWQNPFVILDCKPQEIDDLRKMVREFIHEIKTGHDENMDIFRVLCDGLLYPRYSADRSNRNALMIKRLYNYYRFKEPMVDPIKIENFVRSLTLEDIQKTGQKYLQNENRMEFMMK